MKYLVFVGSKSLEWTNAKYRKKIKNDLEKITEYKPDGIFFHSQIKILFIKKPYN